MTFGFLISPMMAVVQWFLQQGLKYRCNPPTPRSAGPDPVHVRRPSLAFISMLTRTRGPSLALLTIMFCRPGRPGKEKLDPIQRDLHKHLQMIPRLLRWARAHLVGRWRRLKHKRAHGRFLPALPDQCPGKCPNVSKHIFILVFQTRTAPVWEHLSHPGQLHKTRVWVK